MNLAAVAQRLGPLAIIVAVLARSPQPLPGDDLGPGLQRGWLGVTVLAVAGADGESTSPPGALRVVHVVAGGPADRAGLREGDVVAAVDGRHVTAVAQLVEALARHAPGSDLPLAILRAGHERRMSARLVAPPAGDETKGKILARIVADADPAGALRFAGSRERPDLGIETMDLTPGLRAYFGVPPELGTLVASVTEGSPAASAGLRAGDVVVRLAGHPVASGRDVAEVLRDLEPGAPSTASIVRDRKSVEIAIVPTSTHVPVWVFEAAQEGGTNWSVASEAEAKRLRLELERLVQAASSSRSKATASPP